MEGAHKPKHNDMKETNMGSIMPPPETNTTQNHPATKIFLVRNLRRRILDDLKASIN